MWDVLLDALIDSAKILPILLVVYFLIEFIEYYYGTKLQKSKFLKGKASPVFGALFGSIPQCGFSIVATDLYSKKALSIGALVAVYIATSDEALPLMISDPSKIIYLLLLIGVKIVMAISAGYLAMLILPRLFSLKTKKTKNIQVKEATITENIKNSKSVEEDDDNNHEEHDHKHEHDKKKKHDHIGCCSHDIDEQKKYNWKHPLIHSFKIFAIILAVNIIMGIIIYYVGEDKISAFLTSNYIFQPLFACLVGLIPNCAASVVLTELFMMESLSFGSIVAGLSINAGLAMLFLFKQNKSLKENISIIVFSFLFSLGIGYALHFIPFI